MAAIMWMTGVSALVSNLKRADARIQAACQRGIAAGANHLRTKSMEIVPVQTGVLKASCHAPRNIGGHGFKCDYVISYGAGTSGKYAVYVHEDLTKAHGKAFNIKHAAEIAAAGHYVTSKTTGKQKWKADTFLGTAQGGMFPRGENQQAKFLEQPMRTERKTIIGIISRIARNW